MSSPLKNNTTTIQELLNTINNLPEAGSGGDLKYATGSFTVTSTGATVTGLGFTPKHIVASISGVIEIDDVGNTEKPTLFVQGGLYSSTIAYHYTAGATNDITHALTSYGHIDILDDGFTMGTGTGMLKGTFYDGDAWEYLAIG